MNELLKMFEGMKPKRPQFVVLNKEVLHTKYLYGTIAELQSAVLILFEKSSVGDCLCQVNGEYLVDVDRRDIQRVV